MNGRSNPHGDVSDVEDRAASTAPAGRGSESRWPALKLSLTEHHIGMVVPPGSAIGGSGPGQGTAIDCPLGVVVFGAVNGDIVCRSGSLVIAKGGSVNGNVTADRIYIEGELRSGPGAGTSRPRAKATARLQIVATPDATIDADLASRSFALQTRRLRGNLLTLPEGQDEPQWDDHA